MDIQSLDKKLFFLINHGTSNPVFDMLMPFLTGWGFLLLLPFLFLVLREAFKERPADGQGSALQTAFWALFLSFCSFLLADWLAQELKHVIGRIRPCNTLEGVRLLVGCTGSYSMPSNHAANSFAAAIPLYYFTQGYRKMVRLYPLILAALISYSRVYVGVHYPADILAGALLGTVLSIFIIGIYKYAAARYKSKPNTTLLFAGLAAISIFRIYFIQHGPLDLSPDEAHYWEWSRRLDLSYYSKGPMIAYLIYIGALIFGNTVWGIRIPAVVFSTLSSMYLFKLAALMYSESAVSKNTISPGESVGLYSALLLQIIPLFAPFGVIFTIDAPFIFFWILALYLFWKAVNTVTSNSKESNEMAVTSNELENKESEDLLLVTRHPLPPSDPSLKVWIVLGISIGFGLLTKYTMAFFYLCGFLFLLLSEKRYLLKTVKPYAALLVSILCFSPVIIWNMQHDWITLRHTAGQAHIAEGVRVSLESFLEFLGSQVGAVTPILFGMMLYSLFKLQLSARDSRSQFLFYFSVPVIGFFVLKSLQGKVQANWAMNGYITGIIAFSQYFLGARQRVKTDHPSRITRYVLFAGIGLALFVTAIAHYPAVVKLPPKLDPSSRLRGWDELGMEVNRIYSALYGPARDNVLIFSDSYQVASELAFYVKGHPKTYAINLGRRMNQYDLWTDMNSDATGIRKRRDFLPDTINGIFVKIGDADIPPEVAKSFDKHTRDVLKVYERGHLLREYSIFTLYNFKGLRTEKPETY